MSKKSVTLTGHAGSPRRRSRDTPRPGAYAETIIARIRAIPRGLVCTYADIDPHAPRAVGRILATTDADIPWHRVVRADGTAAMGSRQLERLRAEGVSLRGDRVDFAQTRARWNRRRVT